MASGTIVVIPSTGANIIQAGPGLPSVPLQAPGVIPYSQYGVQLGTSTIAPQQIQQNGPLEKFLSAEAKVLGAIQIMIGLIHIGFGAVSLCRFSSYYRTLFGIGGYPFWGGIFFISSGSVCVAAANRPNRCLVKSSVGINMTSAIMSSIGIILYLCELISNSFSRYDPQDNAKTLRKMMVYGLSGVLLLFSLLEFCITVSLAHFGCQATCCSNAQPTMIFVPYQVIGDGAVTAEPNPPAPPTYNDVVTKSQ